jgi:hypothetical protein
MMLEASCSIVLAALVIARAINVLLALFFSGVRVVGCP